MSKIIRPGGVALCALTLAVLMGSLAAGMGQDVQSAPGTSDTAKPDAPKEATPTPPVATPPAAEPPAAPAAQSESKGKAAKHSKDSKPAGPGILTAIGVQEKPYEIGPEDVLYLNVLHQIDVSQTLEVRPDGFVSVRFAGEIKAAGMTSQQLADTIAEKLKTYFNNPEVNIQVLKINSKKYYISGGVRKPGAYPLTAPKTVLEALIEAGGFTDFAKKTKIYVLRGQTKFPFNYKDVSRDKNLQQNILLQNGDVVQVPE